MALRRSEHYGEHSITKMEAMKADYAVYSNDI